SSLKKGGLNPNCKSTENAAFGRDILGTGMERLPCDGADEQGTLVSVHIIKNAIGFKNNYQATQIANLCVRDENEQLELRDKMLSHIPADVKAPEAAAEEVLDKLQPLWAVYKSNAVNTVEAGNILKAIPERSDKLADMKEALQGVMDGGLFNDMVRQVAYDALPLFWLHFIKEAWKYVVRSSFEIDIMRQVAFEYVHVTAR
ncbi:hypothetical protein TSOC_008017, partial [Tetrabaena socialis]